MIPTPSRHILYVHNSADIYGASRSLLRLLPMVKAKGYTPLVLLPEDGVLRERIAALGVEVLIDPGLVTITRSAVGSGRLVTLFSGFLPNAMRIRRLVRERGINLVHTNTGVIPAPALGAKLAGVPHIWHVRDSFQEFRSLWTLYRRYITGLSQRVIAVSNPIAAQFGGAEKVVVIHNGLSMEEFPGDVELSGMREKFREAYRLGNGLVIGCVGRIKFVRKGQEVLVQAGALLKQRGIRARYLLVGSPALGNEEHLERLQGLIDRLGMREDVCFTGELADVKPAYAAMDVFVLPSAQPEPFGGVVLEAMGMRLPVIATAIGGSLDQVEEGQSGFLIPPSDPAALAEKLTVLLGDAGLRKKMGIEGRERLRRHFSIDRMVDQFLGLYDSLLAGKERKEAVKARGKGSVNKV